MICPQCHQENSANNRFCGMCGAKLEAAKVKVDPSAPSVMWLENEEPKPQKPAQATSREDVAKAAREREAAERTAREREMAERAARAAVRERELASRMGTERVEVEDAARQRNIASALSGATRKPVNVAGPSFLGLNDGDEPEPPAGRIEEEDERSDIYGGGGRSYSRALLLLVVLLVVAGLLFLQWRYSRGLEASPPVAKPSASQPSDTAGDDSESNQEDAAAAKSESAAPAGQADVGKSESKSETPAQPPKSEASKSEPSKSANPKQQATSADMAEQPDDAESAETAQTTTEQPKPSARGRVQAEPSLEQSDEPLRLAESYLQGRGLPKSCPKGVEILREASNRGNYKAQIKLGALYTTGNCVSVDRVQAYRYFTRALQTKPDNTWVEQNRSMLWAQMNEQERRQAMEQRF